MFTSEFSCNQLVNRFLNIIFFGTIGNRIERRETSEALTPAFPCCIIKGWSDKEEIPLDRNLKN